MFLVYVGFREVFPRGYSYWGMASGFSDPVVYLFLWVIGIWDLLHTSIHRHSLGRDLRIGTLLSRQRRSPVGSGSPQEPNRLSGPRTRGSHPRTPSQVERGFETEAAIALSEVHSSEKKSAQLDMMSRSGASSTSGESSSQAAPAEGQESQTVSAVTSRRTSTIKSDDSLEAEGVATDVAREEYKA